MYIHGVSQTNKLYTVIGIMPVAYVQKLMEEQVYMFLDIYILQ